MVICPLCESAHTPDYFDYSTDRRWLLSHLRLEHKVYLHKANQMVEQIMGLDHPTIQDLVDILDNDIQNLKERINI